MAENPSGKRLRSFSSFWGGAIKSGWSESREKFGLVVDITLALSAIGLLGFARLSKIHPNFNAEEGNAIMSYWFAVIPVGLWLIWLGWHIFRAPYDIYKEQFGKHESEIGEKDAQIQLKDTEIQSLTEKLKDALDNKAKIEELEIHKKMAKTVLAVCLTNLQDRLDEVRGIGMYSYNEETRKQQEATTIEKVNDTIELLNKYKGAEIGAFFRTTNPKPIGEPTGYNMFDLQEHKWRNHINYLEAHIASLRIILAKQSGSGLS